MIKFKRLIKSFSYAGKGLARIIREEQNIRIQIGAGMLAVLFGLLLGISPVEWCLIVVVIGFVVLMEAVNSAVERIADVLRPRINDYVKEIKDITAAAVMLASIMAIIVGSIIFIPRILSLT